MTEPQTWTVIGGFLTGIFAMLTVVTTSFNRTVRSEVGSVRTELGSLRNEMASEFRHLDRDVQALTRHVFDRPE